MQKILFLLTTFSSFFGKEPTHFYENIEKNQPIDSGIYIKNSRYTDLYGGTLYFSSEQLISVLIELSTFMNCSSTSSGAGVYFLCTSGAIVLYKICAYSCFLASTNSGQFAYLYTGSTNNNSIIFLNVQKCAPSYGSYNREFPLVMYYGNQIVSNNNFSYNFVYKFDLIGLYYMSSLSGQFNTFIYNQASNQYGSYFYSGSGTTMLSRSNFLINYQNDGLIYISSFCSFIMDECIFIDNHHFLYYCPSSYDYMTFKNCWIKNPFSIYSGPYYPAYFGLTSTSGLTETYSITHFITNYCEPKLIGLGFLTPCQTIPIIPTTCFYSNINGSVINLSISSILHFALLLSLLLTLF